MTSGSSVSISGGQTPGNTACNQVVSEISDVFVAADPGERNDALFPGSNVAGDPFALVGKLEREHALSFEEWVALISRSDDDALREHLMKRARQVRNGIYGNKVFTRGLIEFTNYCKNDCLYCGIRAGNREARRYRLTKEEILACCAEGHELGFRTFVLQGGEDPFYDDERMCDIVSAIREAYPDCAITLSLGERSRESYQRLFDAGADRYLLRHETADGTHYASLHPASMSLGNRKQCLRDLREIGYQVGSGFMVGSPGQTPECLAQDMLFLAELKPHMVGIGPFVPHRQTQFATCEAGTLNQTLFLLSCLRLMMPKVLLPATTALGTIDPLGRELGMDAGANVVMPNLSPVAHRADYDLYDNKICTGEEAAECRFCLQRRMHLVGYEVVVDRGDSLVS